MERKTQSKGFDLYPGTTCGRQIKTVIDKVYRPCAGLYNLSMNPGIKTGQKRDITLFDSLPPQAIIDSLPFQMAIIDKRGIIRQVNAAWKAFGEENGAKPKTISGIGLDYLKVCKGDKSPRGQKVVAGIEAILSGKHSEFQSEYPCHGNKQKRWFILKVSALKPPVKGAVIAHFQITERVLAERALRKSELELIKSRDIALKSELSKSRFLAHMSHEIRTPLNGIIGLTEMLKDSALDPEQRSKVDTLYGLADHLLGIVNDVLDLAKYEAGKLTFEDRPFEPGLIVKDVMATLNRAAEEKGINLNCAFGANFPHQVGGDARRLRQILLNLAGNAIKFTDKGSVSIQAEAKPGAAGSLVLEFSIRDTGIGISPEFLPKLFLPFSQAEGQAKKAIGGTGLGLAICRYFAEAMGGGISATSAPGRGSVFTVTILVRIITQGISIPEPSEGITGSEKDWTAIAPGPQQGTLLVADDNGVNRQVMSYILKKLGWSVLLAEDGQQALGFLEKGGIHALFLDCQMPVMDGYETALTIRRKETLQGDARLPIIAITADVMEENLQRCRDAGMDDFLLKPFRSGDVSRLLSRMQIK